MDCLSISVKVDCNKLRAVKNSGERDGGDPECPSVQKMV